MVDVVDKTDMSFAARLRRLFDSVTKDGGEKYTATEVAAEITARGKVKVSKTYLYDLLNGQKTSPSWQLVQALADFFEVQLDYFSDDERAHDLNRQYEALAVLGEAGAQRIAARASELTPEALESVMRFIEFQADQSRKQHPEG
ncbi:helix-turn-helix transcriptional regulator [Saccharopolyspora sp. NPDC047091]|uniref:helix-turn-helix domain-containing protein n=1 Tax=Saccharopolyspora sp. NPDC047091 TaxID=3155924 RepID=UPI0033DACF68